MILGLPWGLKSFGRTHSAHVHVVAASTNHERRTTRHHVCTQARKEGRGQPRGASARMQGPGHRQPVKRLRILARVRRVRAYGCHAVQLAARPSNHAVLRRTCGHALAADFRRERAWPRRPATLPSACARGVAWMQAATRLGSPGLRLANFASPTPAAAAAAVAVAGDQISILLVDAYEMFLDSYKLARQVYDDGSVPSRATAVPTALMSHRQHVCGARIRAFLFARRTAARRRRPHFFCMACGRRHLLDAGTLLLA